MSERLNIILIVIAITIFIGIISLIVKRKLNEEFSFIWIIIAFVFLILAIIPEMGIKLAEYFGTILPINTFFFLAIILILFLCLYFSLKISTMTNRIKNLTQQVAILKSEIDSKE